MWKYKDNGLLQNATGHGHLAVVLILLIAVLVVLLVLIVLILVLIVLLILLVIHSYFLQIYLYCGLAARVVYPNIYALSFALMIKLTIRPLTIAAVMPPAVDFSPPVKTPRIPSLCTASFTPFARQ